MKARTAALWVVGGSALAYLIWAIVLRYGTPAEKAAVTAAVIVSPIPPVP